MEYFIAYVIILMMALAMSIKFDKKIDVTMFISIASIAIFEYVFGIIFGLKIAKIGTYIIFAACATYIIYKAVKNKSIKLIYDKVTPGCILLTILYIVIILLYKEKYITWLDNLRYWGLVAKDFFYTNSLPDTTTNILHLSYTPITGMWYYWFASSFEKFADGNLYIACALFQCSLAVAITSFIQETSKIKNILINIIFIAMLFAISYISFTELYTDVMMGLVFAFCILYIFKLQELNFINIVVLAIGLSILGLVRVLGIIFVLLALLLFFIKGIRGKVDKKKLVITILLLFILVLGLQQLWNIYLIQNGLNNIAGTDTSKFNVESITEFVKGDSEEYRYETLKQYMLYLVNGKNFTLFNQNISVLLFLGITIAILVTVYIVKKDKEVLHLLFCVIGVNILFLSAMLITYLFVFSKWEAEMLSAIERYIQTINVINISAILYVLYDKINRKTIVTICLITIIILSGPNRGWLEIKDNETKIKNTASQRRTYADIEKYRDIFNKNDKIYLVTEHEEYENWREQDLVGVKYVIAPYRVYMTAKTELTKQEIIDKLSCGYTYIYFFQYNNDANRYGFLLDNGETIKNKTLYKIIEKNNEFKIKKINI